jgi:RNA polymerase sigma-70 factor, ECF subfamily
MSRSNAVSLSTAAVLEATRDRRELTGYCSKILGSAFEADDAVQETMVRAWTRRDSFEGRSSVHSWVYRIATNVCLDMLRRRNRRAVPMDLDGLEVLPHDQDLQAEADPADLVAEKDEIQLALMVALEALPARQRAVLILREVLRWSAPEVADLLGTTVASVNSALQRARATLASRSRDHDATLSIVAGGQQGLLADYVTAFEHYDMASLVSLLRDEASPGAAPNARNATPFRL